MQHLCIVLVYSSFLRYRRNFFFTAATQALLNIRRSIIAVILTAYDIKGAPYSGATAAAYLPLDLAAISHPSVSRACAMSFRRERITCRMRRFIRGKIKNKHRAVVRDGKKRRIEGDLRSIKVSPGNAAASPSSLASVTSDPLRAVRSNFYKRVECPRGIYYPGDYCQPLLALPTRRFIDTLNSSILNWAITLFLSYKLT